MDKERIYLITINFGVMSNVKYTMAAITIYQACKKAEKRFKTDYAAEKKHRIVSVQESDHVFIE